MSDTLRQALPRRSNAPLSDEDRRVIERLEAMYPRPKPTVIATPAAPKKAPVAPITIERVSLLRPIAFAVFTAVAWLAGVLMVVTPEGRATYDQAAVQLGLVIDRGQELIRNLGTPPAP